MAKSSYGPRARYRITQAGSGPDKGKWRVYKTGKYPRDDRVIKVCSTKAQAQAYKARQKADDH